MTKLYQKSEISFAILWIVVYVVLSGIADQLSEAAGVMKSVTAALHIAMSLVLIFWIRKNDLGRKYGFCRSAVPVKRFLYYLRGVLACQWIEANKSIPPVRFKELYKAMVTDANIKAKIEALIEIKKEGKECDMLSVDNELVEYAQHLADYYNKSIGSFRPEQNKMSAKKLDSILFDMVKQNS
jgi:predicted nucleotidyltransferase